MKIFLNRIHTGWAEKTGHAFTCQLFEVTYLNTPVSTDAKIDPSFGIIELDHIDGSIGVGRLMLGLSPGLRQRVKTLLTVYNTNLLVPTNMTTSKVTLESNSYHIEFLEDSTWTDDVKAWRLLV